MTQGANNDSLRHTGGGYGMLAVQDIAPLTPLFTIPATALLNIHTLSPHYTPKFKNGTATAPLSSVQIISLHLLLHRPAAISSSGRSPGTDTTATPEDPLFGPYIAILPSEFNAHPLVWYRRRLRPRDTESPAAAASQPGDWLLDHLPPFVRRDLERIAKTWEADWKRVRGFVVS